MFKALCVGLLLGALAPLQAQIEMPQPSPKAELKQAIGLMDATITYSRPSARGRKIFGDLVPFGKLWRTGANMATVIEFSDSVTIGGKNLAPGKYSLFSIPDAQEWTLILNSVWNQGGTSGYDEAKDVVRIKTKPDIIPFTETFTIDFNYITRNSAFVEISWETSKVSFKVETSVDDKVLANIRQALNVSATSYFQAARYYYDTNRDLNQALEWINKSLEMEERFWVLRQKALIQAKMGDYKNAIATAELSIAQAKEAGNEDYVRLNTESIEQWKKK